MRRCDCGANIEILSLFDVCHTCLQEYLELLPQRPNFSVREFQRERQQQATSIAVARPREDQRVVLHGASLDAITLAETLADVEHFANQGTPHHIVTLNVDLIRIAQHNERFRRIVNQAALSIADGKPLQWAARWTGQELPARITGMDLLLGTAEIAAGRHETIFLLGAAQGIAARAAMVLRERFPGLSVQSYAPPIGEFSAEENARMIDMIRESGATYLFVALGSPRGQIWLDEHLHALDVAVCAEIGGVFNFLAGAVKRAPEWVQQAGLEWLYRIYREPTRLWRRYFVQDLPVFLRMLAGPIAPQIGANVRPAYLLQPVVARAFDFEAQPLLEHAVGGS